MKLKALLTEGTKKLSNNFYIKDLIRKLRENPGSLVTDKLEQIIKKTASGNTNDLVDLYDDIEAAYKTVDAKVAKMIEIAISDVDDDMLEDKHKKLEQIKKTASSIQLKLKKKK